MASLPVGRVLTTVALPCGRQCLHVPFCWRQLIRPVLRRPAQSPHESHGRRGFHSCVQAAAPGPFRGLTKRQHLTRQRAYLKREQARAARAERDASASASTANQQDQACDSKQERPKAPPSDWDRLRAALDQSGPGGTSSGLWGNFDAAMNQAPSGYGLSGLPGHAGGHAGLPGHSGSSNPFGVDPNSLGDGKTHRDADATEQQQNKYQWSFEEAKQQAQEEQAAGMGRDEWRRARRQQQEQQQQHQSKGQEQGQERRAGRRHGTDSVGSDRRKPRSSFQQHLRRLYMKVHPDLFEAYPEEKAINGRSFALLNDLLDSLKSGKFSVKQYDLEFYLKTDPKRGDQAEAEAESGGAEVHTDVQTAASLDCVRVSIPLDISPSSHTAISTLKRSIRRHMRNLFEMCGIRGDFTWEGSVFDKLKGSDGESWADTVEFSDAFYDDEDGAHAWRGPGWAAALGKGVGLTEFMQRCRVIVGMLREEQRLKEREIHLAMVNLRLNGYRVVLPDNISRGSARLDAYNASREDADTVGAGAARAERMRGEEDNEEDDDEDDDAESNVFGAKREYAAEELLTLLKRLDQILGEIDPARPDGQGDTRATDADDEVVAEAVADSTSVTDEQTVGDPPSHQLGTAAEASPPDGNNLQGANEAEQQQRPGQMEANEKAQEPVNKQQQQQEEDEDASQADPRNRPPQKRAHWKQQLVVMIEDSIAASRIDQLGRVQLSVDDDDQTWREWLEDALSSATVSSLSAAPAATATATATATASSSSSSSTSAAFRSNAWQITRQLEAQVSDNTGIFSVFGEPKLQSDPSYVAFLRSLNEHKDAFQELWLTEPDLTKVVVRVHAPQLGLREGINPRMGFIMLPHTHKPQQVIQCIRSYGRRALETAKTFQSRMAEYEAATLAVRRRLRLVSLERGRGVTRTQMLECCRRLVALHPDLKEMLMRMPIRVTKTGDQTFNRRGVVCIPWDFYQ